MATVFATSAAIAAPLTFAQPSFAQTFPAGPYIIENQTTGLCLQTNPSNPDGGVQVVLEPCTGLAAQEWYIENPINTTYQLENVGNLDCLDAPVNADFGIVETFPCDGISNENWSPNFSPPFTDQRIVSLVGGLGATHRCLDVSHGNIVAGGVVGLYRCFGTDNGAQEWTAILGPG
jgi:hypothetical protein